VAFTYVTITHTFETAADLAAAGEVDFLLVEPIHNGITVVAKTITAPLSGAGLLSVNLASNTDPGTIPTGTTYKVTERITGQTAFSYYIQIPHDQGSTLDLRELAGWVGNTSAGSGVLTVNSEAPNGFGDLSLSAGDVGAQPIADVLTRLSATPVTITYAASITPDPTLGCFFRVVATGDLTVPDIGAGGLDGQIITLRVTASGAQRTLIVTGAGAFVIPSGQPWYGRFIYDGPLTSWAYLG